MSFKENGFEIHSEFLDEDLVNEIISDIESLDSDFPKHGLRHAHHKLNSVKKIIESKLLIDQTLQYLSGQYLSGQYLDGKPKVVRVIVFDKTPDKNWLVSWHQDKTICVSHKKEIEGWGPWTIKDGKHHVQPSLDVLEKMVTFRIHLDDADEKNGCLKVIPGSHEFGVLNKIDQNKIINETEPFICNAKKGDLLVMRPHLLHSSSKGTEPSHRRILHIEYSGFNLPEGLNWEVGADPVSARTNNL